MNALKEQNLLKIRKIAISNRCYLFLTEKRRNQYGIDQLNFGKRTSVE